MKHKGYDENEENDCYSKITFTTYNTVVQVDSVENMISVNDLLVQELPYKTAEVVIRRVGQIWIVVEGRGWSVMINRHEVDVTLSPIWATKVRGLCGTYNFNKNDDFLTPYGNEETSVENFAKTYQTQLNNNCKEEPTSQDTACVKAPAVRDQAMSFCQILRSSWGPYVSCSSEISQEELDAYYEHCVESACIAGGLKGACPLLLNAAHRCTELGVDVSWFDNDIIKSTCAAFVTQCKEGHEYSECIDSCETTCRTISKNANSCQRVKECFPGCKCPHDTVYDDHTKSCVPPSKCTCFDEYTRRHFANGESIMRGCQICTCNGGISKCALEEEKCDKNICPENQEVLEYVSPCRVTCSNVDRVNFTACQASVFQGCGCPEGTVYSGEKCVKPEACPCFHSGQEFEEGQSIKINCNQCTCKRRQWECSNNLCDATCTATGESHYITFDRTAYTFEGRCEYTLVEAVGNDQEKIFEVSSKNLPCQSSGVSCTKEVVVHLHQPREVIIKFVRGLDVTINDNLITLPYYMDDIGLELYKKGQWFVLVTKLDIRVMWDGGTRVMITLLPSIKDHVLGLCGNYNGRSDDDFMTVSGDIEDNPYIFADAYKTDLNCQDIGNVSEPPLPASEEHPHRRAWAKRSCLIISKNTLFDRCREQLAANSVEQFHKWCEYDACACDTGGDCECLCTAIAAFAEACNDVGVPVTWRSQDLCPFQCENDMVYKACGSICPNTCESVSQGLDRNENCNKRCVEGCFCPDGLVQHGNRCVPREACPCYHERKGYSADTFLKRNCQDCLCTNGTWRCAGEPCNNETCTENEFQCPSHPFCIPNSWVCDGFNDCDDGSDEFECAGTCAPGYFLCNDATCIPNQFRCDGTSNCPDSSDEYYCPYTSCGPEQFVCKSGVCAPLKFQCDGDFDCGPGDTSDEDNCECPKSRSFHCIPGDASSKCLPITHLCDGHDDCGDMSDELGCNCTCINGFTCGNCDCIDPQKKCDGVQDCDTDEQFCSCPEFTCNDGKCILLKQLCDGTRDREHNEDEHHPSCRNEATTLLVSTPVSTIFVCPDFEFTCSEIAQCIPLEHKCDGQSECADNSDETDCEFTTTKLPGDCVYEVAGEEFVDITKNFPGGVAAKYEGGVLTFTFPEDRELTAISTHTITSLTLKVEPQDEFDVIINSPSIEPIETRSNETKLTEIESVKGVRRVIVRSENNQSLEAKHIGVIRVHACEEKTTTAVTAPTATTPPICFPTFKNCANVTNCLYEEYFCDGVDDCIDKSDEANCCKEDDDGCVITTPSPSVYENCSFILTRKDREQFADTKVKKLPDGSIDFSDPDNIIFTYNEPTVLSHVFVHVSEDSYVRIRPFGPDGEPRGPSWLVHFNWFHYALTYERPITNVKKLVIQYERPGVEELKGDITLVYTIACAERETTTSPTTPPPVCNEITHFTCQEIYNCVPLSQLCDGTYDCSDQSDEEDCVTTITTTPSVTTTERKCDKNFFQCDSRICIYIGLRCNGEVDCPHGSDEIGCKENTTTPVRPTEEPNRSLYSSTTPKILPDGSIEFPNDMTTVFNFEPPTGISDIIIFVTEDSFVKIQLFDRSGEPLGPESVIQFNYYHSKITYDRPIGNVARLVVSYNGTYAADHVGDIIFIYVIGCVKIHPTSPATPPTICSDFICSKTRECVANDTICDRIYDCEDQSDEENCTETGRTVPPLSTLQPNCIFAFDERELNFNTTTKFDGMQATVDMFGVLYINFDEPQTFFGLQASSYPETTFSIELHHIKGDVMNIDVLVGANGVRQDIADISGILSLIVTFENIKPSFLKIEACRERSTTMLTTTPDVIKDCVHGGSVSELSPDFQHPSSINAGVVAYGTSDKITFVFSKPVNVYGISGSANADTTVTVEYQVEHNIPPKTKTGIEISTEITAVSFPKQFEAAVVVIETNDNAVLSSIFVHTCELRSTTQSVAITYAKNCVFRLTGEDLSEPTKNFDDASATITSEKLTIAFNEPKQITSVKLQTDDGRSVKIVAKTTDDNDVTRENIPSGTKEPLATVVQPPIDNVINMALEGKDMSNFSFIEVIACQAETTSVSTIVTKATVTLTSGPKTTTIDNDCVFELADIESQELGVFKINKRVIELHFLEPRDVTAVLIQTTDGSTVNVFSDLGASPVFHISAIGSGTNEPLRRDISPPFTDVTEMGVSLKDMSTFVFLKIEACKRESTPKPETTSVSPDCVYGLEESDIETSGKTFGDNVTAEIRVNEGQIEITFPNPRSITAFFYQSTDGEPEASIVATFKNTETRTARGLPSNNEIPEKSTFTDWTEVTTLIIELDTDTMKFVEIDACETEKFTTTYIHTTSSCDRNILMDIPVSNFMASSFLPKNTPDALRTPNGWIPEPNDFNPWIQVELGAAEVIEKIQLGGNGKAVEVLVSNDEGDTWTTIETMTYDAGTTTQITLSSKIVAQSLKFIIKNTNTDTGPLSLTAVVSGCRRITTTRAYVTLTTIPDECYLAITEESLSDVQFENDEYTIIQRPGDVLVTFKEPMSLYSINIMTDSPAEFRLYTQTDGTTSMSIVNRLDGNALKLYGSVDSSEVLLPAPIENVTGVKLQPITTSSEFQYNAITFRTCSTGETSKKTISTATPPISTKTPKVTSQTSFSPGYPPDRILSGMRVPVSRTCSIKHCMMNGARKH